MGAVLNAPVLADGLSADRRRQDGVADEPGRLAGRPPEPGRGGAGKNIASDTNDGADMIGPFGTGQAIAWREHLDQPQFVAGMNAFARDLGILATEVPYESVVATEYAPLWMAG